MSKKKYTVRAECPSCACGDVSFLGPEKLRRNSSEMRKRSRFFAPCAERSTKGKIEEEKE